MLWKKSLHPPTQAAQNCLTIWSVLLSCATVLATGKMLGALGRGSSNFGRVPEHVGRRRNRVEQYPKVFLLRFSGAALDAP